MLRLCFFSCLLFVSSSLTAVDRKPASALESEVAEPFSVRLGLVLTDFQKISQRKNGKDIVRFQPNEEVRRTLRSRLNKSNHFYVGNYHIQTKPMMWKSDTKEYALRLQFFRRYGAFGQLEESIGSIDVKGLLSARQGNVFVLYGSSKTRLRDKFGNPILDVVAGYKPAPKKKKQISTRPKAKPQVRRAPRAKSTVRKNTTKRF